MLDFRKPAQCAQDLDEKLPYLIIYLITYLIEADLEQSEWPVQMLPHPVMQGADTVRVPSTLIDDEVALMTVTAERLFEM